MCDGLRKHSFLLALRRWGRLEKRVFSQARCVRRMSSSVTLFKALCCF